MRARSLSVPGLLLTLLVGVSACASGDPSAEPTPIMPSSTTPTPTSTPTPEPEAWEVQSRAGVKAFLQRYVEIFSEAERAGETEPYRALTTSCDGCDAIADQIDEVYEAGGRIEAEPLKFTGWSVDEGALGDSVASTVVFDSSVTRWVREPGGKPDTYPAAKIEYIVSLEWTGDSWTVVGVFPLED